MCCAHTLSFLVTLACSRHPFTACFNYHLSLNLSPHVRCLCTAICPLCNVPASSLLLMLAGALAVIGVLSWTCGPLPPWRLCLLHLSRGYATLHKPLPPPGSQRFGSPMMNLAGMANSIGCLGRRLVSGFYVRRPVSCDLTTCYVLLDTHSRDFLFPGCGVPTVLSTWLFTVAPAYLLFRYSHFPC